MQSYLSGWLFTLNFLYSFYFSLSACTSGGVSSDDLSALSRPEAPSNLVAATQSSSQINLAWQDASSNEDGFQIERADQSEGPFLQVATAQAEAVSFSDTELDSNRRYFYRIRAFNQAGASENATNTAYARTLPAPTTVPTAPSGLSASASGTTEIILSWQDTSDNEEGFRIERGTSPGIYNTSFEVLAGVHSFTDDGLLPDTQYYYQVIAFNSLGDSPPSNPASATTGTTSTDPCDEDGDGFLSEEASCGGDDCNDNDPAINPSMRDICFNGVDEDCSGVADDDNCEGTLCSRDDVIFCNGFEDGNLDAWDDYDGNPAPDNVVLEDTGPFGTSGNHIMRFRVPAGGGIADLVKVLPQTHPRVYARWYQKWEPGYDFTARNHGSSLHAGARSVMARSGYRPDGDDRFNGGFEPGISGVEYKRMHLYSYYRGMYQDCANPNGSCWGDHFPCTRDEGYPYCEKPEHRETIMPPQMNAGQWYCFETMLDGGTPVASDDLADGRENFWIDGVEYGPFEHLWMRTTSDLEVTILWLKLYHHSTHSVEGFLLDEVVVSTERIGCEPTGIN